MVLKLFSKIPINGGPFALFKGTESQGFLPLFLDSIPSGPLYLFAYSFDITELFTESSSVNDTVESELFFMTSGSV